MILSSTLQNEYQRYFSQSLLDHAVNTLILEQFAMKAELPKMAGARSISFFRLPIADANNVTTLAEGVPPTQARQYQLDRVDFDLIQYAEMARISDIAKATQLFDTVKQLTTTFGEEAALFCDTIIRNALLDQTAGLNRRYAQNIANFAALQAASIASSKLIDYDLLDAATQLKNTLTPTINGGYVAIVAPVGSREIMRDANNVWLAAKQYSDVKGLYKGEVGSLYGVRVTEATNPFRETTGAATEGVYSSAGTIYSAVVTGKSAFGVPALSGDKPQSPKVVIVDKPDHADPLGQNVTIAWKAFYAAGVLNPNFGVIVKHKTEYVGL
jgi:N4-gp56 family major capsid protein